jgi:DNA-binding beta-propeller fold protein YncE
LLQLSACGVESLDQGTGGVDLEGTAECPAGVVAVLSDYLSTQVALLAPDGTPASESFISSGSMKASQLAAPLSGDVVAPSNRSTSDEVVLIDRYGTNVVSWVDERTARVRAQIPIGTGFESNPYDYLELEDGRAYVARFGENEHPGDEPFDQGGDLIVLDPSTPALLGRVELRADGDPLPARPVALAPVGDLVWVSLAKRSINFKTQGDSELVGIDPESDSVVFRHTIGGLRGCGRAASSPSRDTVAIACTGQIDFDGNLADPSQSGIVLLDATKTPPVELRRIDAYEALGASPQSDLEFSSESVLLGKTQTPIGGDSNNRLFALDLETSEFEVLREASTSDSGVGFGLAYGGLYCNARCSSVCLLADIEAGLIRRFDGADALAELEPVRVGASSGLPPVGLGPF